MAFIRYYLFPGYLTSYIKIGSALSQKTVFLRISFPFDDIEEHSFNDTIKSESMDYYAFFDKILMHPYFFFGLHELLLFHN